MATIPLFNSRGAPPLVIEREDDPLEFVDDWSHAIARRRALNYIPPHMAGSTELFRDEAHALAAASTMKPWEGVCVRLSNGVLPSAALIRRAFMLDLQSYSFTTCQ